MAASLSYFAGENFNISNLNGSGLGFFGAGGFGTSVVVGAYNGSTFITNSTGATQGPQVDNVKWTHPNSGEANGVPYNLLDIANYLGTLNIRFTNDSAVTLQNTELRIFDRISPNRNPSGVTCKVAEIIHPSTTLTGSLGSGDSSWTTVYGSGSTLSLTGGGLSGHFPGSSSVQHDFYVAITASPDSLGSKTYFGLYFYTEYI